MYVIRYVNADSIKKDIAAIPEKHQKQIMKAVESLKSYGPLMGGIKALKGYKEAKKKKSGGVSHRF